MTKKKLIITLCAFVLVAAVGVIGVLAAATQTATITSSIEYTVTSNVSIDIEYKLSKGASRAYASDTTNTTDTLNEANHYAQILNDGTGNNKKSTSAGTGSDYYTDTHKITLADATFEPMDGYCIRYWVKITNRSANTLTLAPTVELKVESDFTEYLSEGKKTNSYGTYDKNTCTNELETNIAKNVDLEMFCDGAVKDAGDANTVSCRIAPYGTATVEVTMTLADAKFQVNQTNVKILLDIKNVSSGS